MSGPGYKQTSSSPKSKSALPPTTDIPGGVSTNKNSRGLKSRSVYRSPTEPLRPATSCPSEVRAEPRPYGSLARKGFKKAAVAAARKIAVVMLRLWRDGTTFAWTKEALPA